MKKYLLKFAVTLAMLGLIVYTFGHAFGISSTGLITDPVHTVTDRQITSGEAYLFRDESVLVSPVKGLSDPLIESGERAGKNLPVVNVYQTTLADEELSAAQHTLNRLNAAISVLESGEPQRGETLLDAENYRAEATASYHAICQSVKRGDIESILSLEEELLVDLNRYLRLTGKQEEQTAVLEALRVQKAALVGSSPLTVTNTLSSGVFYGSDYVDGYERIFSPSVLEGLTAERFAALKLEGARAESSDTAVGKMVYGYSWYAVMELSAAVAPSFRMGDTYSVTFPENKDIVIDLTLESLQMGGDTALAVFRSDTTPSEFLFYRIQTAEITICESEGFYVPSTALHTQNGVEGVDVFEKSMAVFRRIDVLYRGEGYCIVARPEDSDLTELRLNDLLITSAQDLYDGKVYQ
ncbi:MAG: hypothetical protein IJX13_07070 [Clostridia bacterium]|nr:hypothetical protein [Clostridia bacterium]